MYLQLFSDRCFLGLKKTFSPTVFFFFFRKKSRSFIFPDRKPSGGVLDQGAGAGGGAGLEAQDPKLQYLKNLMLKYLGTDEGEAREHMERAIATVLQFSEQVCSTVSVFLLCLCACISVCARVLRGMPRCLISTPSTYPAHPVWPW